jgi:bifunctional N-acetylglucosamine-1-phosphate-uridyltransferase/glucosamine-1-phosphate-acetyltransferase GlmU-like protein
LKFLSRNVVTCRYRQAITEDVPADALALGRSRQVTKKDWAKRLRGLKSLRTKKSPG